MNELDKLQAYLDSHEYRYERYDSKPHSKNKIRTTIKDKEYGLYRETHNISVYRKDSDERWFNVACSWGTWGFEDGLLELMGSLDIMHPKDQYDSVEGFLSAQDIIDRMEVL